MLVFALDASRDIGSAIARAVGVTLAAHEERGFEDGEHKVRPLVEGMKSGSFFVDSSLEQPATGAEVVKADYRGPLGARNASLVSVVHLLKRHPVIPLEAFLEVVSAGRAGAALDMEKLRAAV